MIMKKRHAYNLAILLAAGSIMISACGKKTDVPADKTVPAPVSYTHLSYNAHFPYGHFPEMQVWPSVFCFPFQKAAMPVFSQKQMPHQIPPESLSLPGDRFFPHLSLCYTLFSYIAPFNPISFICAIKSRCAALPQGCLLYTSRCV